MTNSSRIVLSCATAALTAAASFVASLFWLPDARFPFALALLMLSLTCAMIAWTVGVSGSLARARRIGRVGVAVSA
jgi:hypothetical protein